MCSETIHLSPAGEVMSRPVVEWNVLRSMFGLLNFFKNYFAILKVNLKQFMKLINGKVCLNR